MAETVAAANESGWKDLATKADLAELKAELKAEMAAAVDRMMRDQILVGAALFAAMVMLLLISLP